MLTFAIPMALFDQDFPGHYLRLIKRVRTSVVALVPPHHGVRATLTNGGVSTVVVGGDSFQSVRLTREPESVTLTSPTNASAVSSWTRRPSSASRSSSAAWRRCGAWNRQGRPTTALALFIVFAEPGGHASVRASLSFVPDGKNPTPAGGAATSTGAGIISTRIG